MSGIVALDTNTNPYDETPYESYPYASSHPERLKTIGMLFGMNPPELSTARVLELGCAGGGNIIPIAINYPKSHCVGVDLSKVQIDLAQRQVKDLGLKNMDFRCASIADIDESYGQFDYIICHGVISWVPDFVEAAIFDVCGKLLSPNGLAYISYNTLPGWNMVRSIRDMMLYHSGIFASVTDKVQQARLLLNFIKDSLEGANTPYAEVLKKEAELLSQQPDHYLRHEHLEENNKQFYFHDFMKEAAKRSLQYLGDAGLASMFLGNLPQAIASKLKDVQDIVRVEQYIDFINNRRFRSTILCKADVQLNRNLNTDMVKKFFLGLKIVAEKPLAEVKIDDNSTVQFFYNANKDSPLSSSSPAMKAILYTFAENWNNPLSFTDLIALASKKLPKMEAANIEAEFLNNAMRMVLSGHISIHSERLRSTNVLSDKPKVSKLAAYQAEHMPGLWVTNEMHDRLGISLFEKYMFKYMDGKHDKGAIADALMEHIKKGELTMSKDGQKVEDEKQIRKELAGVIDQTLARMQSSAILV